MKGNEMLFEIIYYTLWFVGVVSVYTGEGVKITEKDSFKRTESQEEIQTA